MVWRAANRIGPIASVQRKKVSVIGGISPTASLPTTEWPAQISDVAVISSNGRSHSRSDDLAMAMGWLKQNSGALHDGAAESGAV